jgi:hypothetical protein
MDLAPGEGFSCFGTGGVFTAVRDFLLLNQGMSQLLIMICAHPDLTGTVVNERGGEWMVIVHGI